MVVGLQVLINDVIVIYVDVSKHLLLHIVAYYEKYFWKPFV